MSESMPSTQNSGLCRQTHCETASSSSVSLHLWPPRCFFTGLKIWKSVLSQSYSDYCSSRLPCRFTAVIGWHLALVLVIPVLKHCSFLYYQGVGGRRFNL